MPSGVEPAGTTPDGRFGRLTRSVAVPMVALIGLGACADLSREGGQEGGSGAASTSTEQASDPADPGLIAARNRSVSLSGTGCGAADPGSGSGIALAADVVLTAAHVVAEADRLEVVDRGRSHTAAVVAYDPLRDLALVEPIPPLLDVPPEPILGELAEDEEGLIVGGAASGDVQALVLDVTAIEMDEVRGQARTVREGYLVSAPTNPGDSGAGLYDLDGRLVGLLFAVSTGDGERSWITASTEIGDFLAENEHSAGFACDTDASELVPVGG